VYRIFIEVGMMPYYTEPLPHLWDECPSWWHNIVDYNHGVLGLNKLLTEYGAFCHGIDTPALSTFVEFQTEEDFTMFLLRWS
jgi:hypothetical protein